MTFTLEGELIISNVVKAECRDLLGLNGVEGISGLTDFHQAYLTWHRENLFRR